MSGFRSSRMRALALASIASLTLAATAFGAATASDTTIDVSPRVQVAAPDLSPADFPGITKVRQGEPLPRLWVVVSRDVQIKRGGEPAFAALRMTCPRGKTWRSGAAGGDVSAAVLDRNARSGKRSVLVMASFSTSEIRPGATAYGTVFALCR
jgi:hypothetical protein